MGRGLYLPTGCRSMSNMPTRAGLTRLAPDKDESQIEGAMGRTTGADHRGQGRSAKASAHAPRFAHCGPIDPG